jgi:hypothetical protein
MHCGVVWTLAIIMAASTSAVTLPSVEDAKGLFTAEPPSVGTMVRDYVAPLVRGVQGNITYSKHVESSGLPKISTAQLSWVSELDVTTKYGTYVGAYDYSHQVRVFLGVPYAKPPVGDLRFEKPQPPELST